MAATPADSLRYKLASIESGRLPAHTRVVTTPAEWNAWGRELAPPAIKELRLAALPQDRVTASGRVDFAKLAAVSNPLMRSLLEGEKPVTVTAHVLSSNGQARVDIERVEVSGVPLQGRALDFLIQQYVIPQYPEAKVNRWFALDYDMDHFEITPAAVTVVMR
jgi:hypothetical protein